jgi:hypothetical protein
MHKSFLVSLISLTLGMCSPVFACQEAPSPIDTYMFDAAKTARLRGVKKECSKQPNNRVSYSYENNGLQFYLKQAVDTNIQTNRMYVSGKIEDAPEVMKKRLLVSLRNWKRSFANPTPFDATSNTTYSICLQCNDGPVTSSPMFECLLAVDFIK